MELAVLSRQFAVWSFPTLAGGAMRGGRNRIGRVPASRLIPHAGFIIQPFLFLAFTCQFFILHSAFRIYLPVGLK